MRAAPCSGNVALRKFDELLRECICIANTNLTDHVPRIQAALPVRNLRIGGHDAGLLQTASFHSSMILTIVYSVRPQTTGSVSCYHSFEPLELHFEQRNKHWQLTATAANLCHLRRVQQVSSVTVYCANSAWLCTFRKPSISVIGLEYFRF